MTLIDKLPLKALRARQGFTQEYVAERVGVSRNTYGSWERYETYPEIPQLIILADIFECSLDTFYFPRDAS